MARVTIDALDYKASFQKDFLKAAPNIQEAVRVALQELMKDPQPSFVDHIAAAAGMRQLPAIQAKNKDLHLNAS